MCYFYSKISIVHLCTNKKFLTWFSLVYFRNARLYQWLKFKLIYKPWLIQINPQLGILY